MIQLPESNIAFSERLLRLQNAIGCGCTHAELYADLEVALSIQDDAAELPAAA